MVLDASLLNAQHIKVRIKGKVEQFREGVAPSPTPIEQGAFRSPSTIVANFTFTYSTGLSGKKLTLKNIWRNWKIKKDDDVDEEEEEKDRLSRKVERWEWKKKEGMEKGGRVISIRYRSD